MSDSINITGFGAVSPAGWTATNLIESTKDRSSLELPEEIARDGSPWPHRVRRVPKPPKLPFLRDPRLRRTSPIGRFCAGAAFDALSGTDPSELGRIGVVFSCVNGCVNYSARYFGEVLNDPSLASPILFPETVYNAPSSHISAAFTSNVVNYTIVGDSSNFISGLEIGARWLLDNQCDSVVVIAGEEYDFLSAEGWQLLDHSTTDFTEGAGALLLRKNAEGPSIERITAPVIYTAKTNRTEAVKMISDQLYGTAIAPPTELLGEGMGAKVAWQCVLAIAACDTEENVSVLAQGESQQAIGAIFRMPK